MTKHAYRISYEQVQELRDIGWTEAQIAEATYVGAMFNFFVRIADAFDLDAAPMWDSDGLPGALFRPD